MSGKIFVIGLGPGNADQITPQASQAAAEAEFFFGYGPYVDRLELRPDGRLRAMYRFPTDRSVDRDALRTPRAP